MRYLIVKTSALGDIVQSFPVVEYIKKRFPDASVDWVVEKRFRSLVETHPLVEHVLCINSKEWKKRWWHFKTWKEIIACIQALRKSKYDAVFDLQGNVKSGVVSFFAKTHKRIGFGWKSAPERLNCCITNYRVDPLPGKNVRQDYLFLVEDFFKETYSQATEELLLKLNAQEKVALDEWLKKVPSNTWMICPGSNWPNKRLSQESLQSFLDHLHAAHKPQFIFLSGSDQELQEVQKYAAQFPGALIADRLSIPLLQHLMTKMALVISVDSFALHLAGTVAVPTFSIFGASLAHKYKPTGEQHFAYQGVCPYGQTFEKRCPILRTCVTGACIRTLDPEVLFTSFQSWWQRLQALRENC